MQQVSYWVCGSIFHENQMVLCGLLETFPRSVFTLFWRVHTAEQMGRGNDVIGQLIIVRYCQIMFDSTSHLLHKASNQREKQIGCNRDFVIKYPRCLIAIPETL